ncbi:hypothetical protein AU79_22265 [Salmonella enterica subsp. enterica serovar Enteritidis str. SA19940857]|nr:hypothetical protein AU79_22265 [Salmonella enterica subsp. enterica serovar Enteritidis str. SA19940857]
MAGRLKQGYQSRVPLDDCTIKTICKAANRGDSLASEVIEHVGRHLGKTIAIAINLFNPQKIVIAGEIIEADKVLLPAIESCINTQALTFAGKLMRSYSIGLFTNSLGSS